MPDQRRLPSGWSQLSIDQICSFQRGVSWKKAQERREPTSTSIPVLRIPNVQERLELRDLLHIEGVSKERLANAIVGKGWILLVGSNGNPRRVGNCVLVSEPGEFVFASFLLAARTRDERQTDPEFLFRVLSSQPVQADISEGVQGSTGLKNINLDRLRALAVLLPPLPEQRKIAAILSSVDDDIEKTQAVIEQVQVVKKGLMQELLTRGLPGRHTKFKQTEIGEVPEEWEVLRLQDLGGSEGRPVLRTGPFGSSLKTEHFRPHGTPVLNIQCLGEAEICKEGLFYVDDRKAKELAEYRVAEGDLVFSRVADVGRSVVVPKEAQGWIISSNLMRISPDPKIVDPHFLMYSIVGGRAVMRQIGGLTAKGGRAVVSSPMLKGLLFPIPALEEQRVIASALEAVEQRIRSEASHADRLAGVKQALMSVLLSGEVRVTPNSEAA